ncbi:Methyl-accepting chemotaxis protein [Chitinispirillum alkaliphilum]|nr:Methyl-accepting chemotaxis protein [Chitinispirillum alkaliphilum]
MLRMKGMTIGKKLIAGNFILLLFVAAGVGLVAIWQASNALQERVEEITPRMAQENALIIRGVLDKYLLTMEVMASNPDIRSMDWDKQQASLEEQKALGGFMGMGIIFSDGTAKYPDGTTARLGDREYFKKAMQGKVNFSNVIISRVTNSAVMMVAAPIRDMEGNISAALIARLDAGWLSETTDMLGYGKNGYAYIIDRRGTLIAHENREYVMEQKNFLEEGRDNSEYTRLSEMFQRMISGKIGFEEYPFMGSDRVFGYAPVPGTGWSIALGAYRADVFNQVVVARNMTVVFVLVFMIIGFVAALMISKTIICPIKQTTDMLKDISEGEGDLTKRLEIRSKDEIGELAGYFNKFVGKLQNLIGSVASNAENVAISATQLSAISTQIAANSEEMSTQASTVATSTEQATTNINSISSAAEEMSGSANSVATAIEEMSASLNEVSRNCQKELQIAAEANTHAKSGKDVMDKLGIAAKSIGKVVEVINDIADQTNLLALNATIEAASAGEAGKGFSVVANEVKELAKQTAHATQEIEDQIEDMQSNTESAVKAIEAVSMVIEEVNSISQTIVSAVEEQSATINEIAQNVSGVSAGAQEVSVNVSESATGLSEVSSTIAGVNDAVADTAKGIVQVKASAEELAKLSETLKILLGQFRV